MSPRAGPRVGAYGDLGAGTEGARRAGRGASPGRGLRSSRCVCAGGSEVLSRCRGPPHSLPWKKERPGSRPGLSTTHRRLPAPHKISTGSVAGGRMEPRPAVGAAPVRLAEVIASPAVAVLAMAFSHINVDAAITSPWRDDACPCESKQTTERCCGVVRSRFVPRRGRHGGGARSTSGRASR